MGGGSSQTTAADRPKGKGPNAQMKADQTVFHFLLENHKAILGTAPAIAAEPFARLDLPTITSVKPVGAAEDSHHADRHG